MFGSSQDSHRVHSKSGDGEFNLHHLPLRLLVQLSIDRLFPMSYVCVYARCLHPVVYLLFYCSLISKELNCFYMRHLYK